MADRWGVAGDGLRVGPLWFHRREQWDMGRHASLVPLLCVHWSVADSSTRLFCIWKWGVLVRTGRRTSRIYERQIDTVIREASL